MQVLHVLPSSNLVQFHDPNRPQPTALIPHELMKMANHLPLSVTTPPARWHQNLHPGDGRSAWTQITLYAFFFSYFKIQHMLIQCWPRRHVTFFRKIYQQLQFLLCLLAGTKHFFWYTTFNKRVRYHGTLVCRNFQSSDLRRQLNEKSDPLDCSALSTTIFGRSLT